MEFKVCDWTVNQYYISTSEKIATSEKHGDNYYYLWKDGTIQLNCMNGWWNSKQEAQEFLDSWLPQKDWLTQDQVYNAANTSDEAAHWYSMTHWKQMVLNFDNVQFAIERGLVSTGTAYCALCKRHLYKDSNSICTLSNKSCKQGGCVPEWSKTYELKLDVYIDMYNKLVTTYNKNFGGKKIDSLDSKIEQAEKDIEVLQVELDKLKAEKKKKETYVFKAGDLVEAKHSSRRLIVDIDNKLKAIDMYDGHLIGGVRGQADFNKFGYKKIGELKDFLS